jgi:hypothetical protein
MCRFMSSESEMLKWKSEGLPADGLSMQNAVIILNSTRTPLVIDPSSQVAEYSLSFSVGKLCGLNGFQNWTDLELPLSCRSLEIIDVTSGVKLCPYLLRTYVSLHFNLILLSCDRICLKSFMSWVADASLKGCYVCHVSAGY